eukprot:jgi/Mesen1/2482/ME000159S01605
MSNKKGKEVFLDSEIGSDSSSSEEEDFLDFEDIEKIPLAATLIEEEEEEEEEYKEYPMVAAVWNDKAPCAFLSTTKGLALTTQSRRNGKEKT